MHNATPRPWKVIGRTVGQYDIEGPQPYAVAQSMAEADADYICRAVNSHDALIEALAQFVRHYDKLRELKAPSVNDFAYDASIAKAALTQAKGDN